MKVKDRKGKEEKERGKKKTGNAAKKKIKDDAGQQRNRT